MTVLELEYAAAIIGALTFLYGVYKIVAAQVNKERDRDYLLREIRNILNQINVVEVELKDTLEHPDDTAFGTTWMREELQEIKALCKEIEHNQLDGIRDGIQSILDKVSRLERAIERMNNETRGQRD